MSCRRVVLSPVNGFSILSRTGTRRSRAIHVSVVLTIGVGRPPVLALVLAFSFGFYGLLKKRVQLSATASLTAESMIDARRFPLTDYEFHTVGASAG